LIRLFLALVLLQPVLTTVGSDTWFVHPAAEAVPLRFGVRSVGRGVVDLDRVRTRDAQDRWLVEHRPPTEVPLSTDVFRRPIPKSGRTGLVVAVGLLALAMGFLAMHLATENDD
jgi:hypothetical protein